MNAILISDLEALEALEESYRTLLQKVGGIESLYYSMDCIRTSLPTFKTLGASLFFIVVFEGEKIRAVLPFQLTRNRAFGLKSVVSFFGECEIYACNNHQKILADGDQPAAMDAAALFLQSGLRKKWDAIEFKWTSMEDGNIKYFVSLFGRSSIKTNAEQSYYFDAALDLESHLGSKQMSNIRRRRRHLENDFGKLDVVVKEEITPDDLTEIMSLHTARQEYKNNDGAFFDDWLEREYVSDLFKLWTAQKCMHYYSLRLDDKLVAIRIMIHAAGVTFGFMMAFDSAFKKYAPARFLTYEAFRHEIKHYGTERIETNWGTNRLKADYSSGTYILYNVEIAGTRLKSKTVFAVIGLLNRLRQHARRLRRS